MTCERLRPSSRIFAMAAASTVSPVWAASAAVSRIASRMVGRFIADASGRGDHNKGTSRVRASASARRKNEATEKSWRTRRRARGTDSTETPRGSERQRARKRPEKNEATEKGWRTRRRARGRLHGTPRGGASVSEPEASGEERGHGEGLENTEKSSWTDSTGTPRGTRAQRARACRSRWGGARRD